MSLDKLNPIVWAIWLIMKIWGLSQKIPVKYYYGVAIVMMIWTGIVGFLYMLF